MIGALLPLAPAIIGAVERLFAKKEKSGAEKMSTAAAMARVLAEKAQANGIAEPQPSDEALRAMIETVFQGMQTSGKVSAPQEEKVFLIRGASISVVELPL